MPRRPHRRVRTSWTGCGCPEGTKKVATCSTRSSVCNKGRGWGCLGSRKTKNGRRIASWVAAVCSTEAPPKLPRAPRKRKNVREISIPMLDPKPPRRKRKNVREIDLY